LKITGAVTPSSN